MHAYLSPPDGLLSPPHELCLCPHYVGTHAIDRYVKERLRPRTHTPIYNRIDLAKLMSKSFPICQRNISNHPSLDVGHCGMHANNLSQLTPRALRVARFFFFFIE